MPVIETLGGALFGAVLQVLFDRLGSRQVFDYFRGKKLDVKLLKKLKRKLVSVNAVVDDAEQKQFRNTYVKAWLDEVRDVLLDTEDLMDEIEYEFSRSELEVQSQSSSSKVCNFESKIVEVLDDLESLLSQKDYLGLKNAGGVGIGLGLSSNVSQKLPSTSLVDENVIYGRDDEKEMILKWMTSDTEEHSQLSILSIVGMGGMGKTTLAQHVYNDPMIEGKFAIKGWVCVSDEFDVFMVTKAIVGAITKSKDDSVDLEMVQGRLKEKLTGRKFLLVLDDVWNEHRDQWKSLQTPLKYGAKGSKIIITTRSNKVASIMESNKIRQLKQLQEDHNWQVFAKHAFQNDNSKPNSELKKIGTKIVEKCQGRPLALEMVGSLLQSKSSVSEWESVLRSNIWNLRIEDGKILPALLLSYYHLPSHLKTCFAYCALFPKDHEFEKESLILSWMAQNFLQCSQQSEPLEEIGEQYFNDLLSRSFFQQSNSLDGRYFVMHDLLNDLAKYVSGDICYRLGVDRPGSVPKTTRHFSIVNMDPIECDEYRSLCDAKRLRTFLSTSTNCEMSIQELISNFKFLRLLSLSYCSNIKEVPDTITDLIHLRSLDLSGTSIERLPDSMCSPCNLQVLKLNDCDLLKELPSTLHELTKLRRIELKGTTLRKVPMLLGKLKNLQVWMGKFEVGKSSSEFSIQQLGQLDLHGELSIGNLENIVDPCDALAADLKNKTHVVKLCLIWNFERNNEDPIKEREVLENLQPSKHLKHLSIFHYWGPQFPSWLSDTFVLNVVSLSLYKCKYCQWLPSLGLLTSLKHLTIDGLDEIVRIDADFYGNSSSAFASLEKLIITDMEELEEWQCMTGAFPSLQFLSLHDCPKLKGHLPDLPHLKDIYIRRCRQLVASTPSGVEIEGVEMETSSFDMIGNHLQYLKIFDCPGMNIPINHCYHFLLILEIRECCDSLTNFPLDLFPKLHELNLTNCRNLQIISQEHPHHHLKSLSIYHCSEFESFPNEGLLAPQIQKIYITEMEKLKSMPKRMSDLLPSLDYLSIRDCPELELSEGCLPSNIKEMRLLNCSKLVASLKKGGWGTNPSIQLLSINEVDGECFPDEGFLPLSITQLDLSGTSIERLPDSMCSPCNLQVLKLNDCDLLKELPSTLHELTKLRRIELKGTTLRKVPMLLGKLKNLQVWMGEFEVGKSSSEFSIQQLGQLDLHGELSIGNLENIVDPCDALAADLKNKTHVVKLCLIWNFERNNEDPIKEREVLENLQPSKHLKHLSIFHYWGPQFPSWLSDTFVLNVVSLSLYKCKYCQWLPSLGLLTSLKHLTIDGLDEIVRIDADFYGNSSSAFASLEKLIITDMEELEEWQCMTGAFPSLQFLSLHDCPKLKGHLPDLPHLKDIYIRRCRQLVASTPSGVEIEGVEMETSSFDMIGNHLQYLKIFDCPGMNIPINHCYHFLLILEIRECCDSLTNFPLDLFPKLHELNLTNCRNLQIISQEHPHHHLKSLSIYHCSEFESFPNEGLLAPQIQKIYITEMEKLKSMPKRMSDLLPSLDYLSIRDCPELELSEGCLPSNIKEMRLLNCSKLVASLKKGGWGTNPSIQLLSINEVDGECFPDEGFLPLSITQLEVRDCSKLKKLDYRGLCHLSSLQKLVIENCPILQCLPEEGLPESISELRIESCPLLKQRCKKKGGEDWIKIAHGGRKKKAKTG